MKIYKLSFGVINIHHPRLAEVIINEGVVMDEEIVGQYHDFLLSNLKAPFCLLINKENAYTYTYKAQVSVADLDEIKAVGVITKSAGAVMATEMLMDMNVPLQSKMKLFGSRADGLAWLAKK